LLLNHRTTPNTSFIFSIILFSLTEDGVVTVCQLFYYCHSSIMVQEEETTIYFG
jgi:hypothetical protein